MPENGEQRQLRDQLGEKASCGKELSPKVKMQSLERCFVSNQLFCGTGPGVGVIFARAECRIPNRQF